MFNKKAYMKQYNKQYYIDNNKKQKEYKKQYYLDNPEKIKEYSKQYYENNREKIKKYNKQYNLTEAGKATQHKKHVKKRARLKTVTNALTVQEWEDVLIIFNNRCAYCGCEFNYKNPSTRDHMIPISKGGDNIKENVVSACRSCNTRKHNKILIGGIYGVSKMFRM